MLSADRNPNTSGAKLRVAFEPTGSRLKAIIDGVNAKKIQARSFVSAKTRPRPARRRQALGDLPCLITTSILPNATTAAATVVLPGAGFAEKRGSMINVKGRLQRLNRAIVPPGDAHDDWEILRDLIQALGGGNGLYMIEDLFKAMSNEVPELAGLSLSKIGDLGVQVIHAMSTRTCPSRRAKPPRPLLPS